MGSLGLKAREEMTVCFVHQLEMDKKVNGVILEEKVSYLFKNFSLIFSKLITLFTVLMTILLFF